MSSLTEGSDPDYVEDDEDEIAAIGLALINAILEYAPIEDIQKLLDEDAPLWYQDEDDGWSALHAAASVEDCRAQLAVDNAGNTAGDIALSLNDEESYRAKLILRLLASRSAEADALLLKEEDDTALGSTDKFLSSRLRYTSDEHGQEICLLQSGDTEIGVMMGWERGIMQETMGLRVLNSWLRSGNHTVIIEPHPDVLRYMRERGWYDRKGVIVLEGKWQDFVGTKILEDMMFDAVYTDTFSEEYEDLRLFFDHLPKLLAGPNARFSFFNGLGATNALFYDVYTHLAELHLSELGIDVEWEDIDVATMPGEVRWGNTREYFAMRLYRLPICKIRNTA
ncbi:hypothetical protein H4582DRAFT_2111855 [Lactarius indigo]|nr:hypothetical protein H4582DRAFT_2111855 [Lactarius indigo]